MSGVRQFIALIAIFMSCLWARSHARSISTIGDVRIDISEERFLCDKIECPSATDYCVVSKEKDPANAAVLVRTNTCYSATNEVLKNAATNENISANARVQLHIIASRNGMTTSGSNSYGNDFDVEKFNRDMERFQQNLQEDLDEVNRDLSNLGLELGNIFG